MYAPILLVPPFKDAKLICSVLVILILFAISRLGFGFDVPIPTFQLIASRVITALFANMVILFVTVLAQIKYQPADPI
jgi:hypothetical protein